MDNEDHYEEDSYPWYSHHELEFDDDQIDEHDESTLVDELYHQNQARMKELDLLSKSKNWIPDDIMLTTQDNDPIIYINSTQEKPEIYPIKLATITLNAELPVNFNLKVLALYLPLDDHIIGVKCEQVCQKGWFKPKPPSKRNKKKKGRKDRADFYNQCTINIRPYGLQSDELINMKVFSNGKIGFTGVKKVVDAEIALKYVLAQIDKLNGYIMYFPKSIEYGNSKNFRKKIKLRQALLEYISTISGYHVDWDEFVDNIQTTGKNPYPNGLHLTMEVSYAIKFMEILLTYYELPFLEQKGINAEKARTYFESVVKQETFKNLCEHIKTGFQNSNLPFTDQELFILINYLPADKKKQLPLDQVAEYLSEQYDLDQIKLILRFYLEQYNTCTLDTIIEALDQSDYEYHMILDIKRYLQEEHEKLTSDEIKSIYQYFLKLKPKWDLEMIIEAIDQSSYHYYSIPYIIKHLTKIYDQLNIDEIDMIYQYFLGLEKNDRDEELPDKELEKEPNSIQIEAEVWERMWKQIDEYLKKQQPEEKTMRFSLVLPCWTSKNAQSGLDIMDFYSNDFINISNINTTFSTNFVLNREKLHQLLIQKYYQTNCSFEPNYGGIKLTYLSTIDCRIHDDQNDPDIEPEYNGCHCKGVSVLIFQNITLITGGRSFRQILQAYEFIKSVMIREFENIIKIDKNCPDPLDKYPNTISSNQHVYIKKKFILDNHRNYFILNTLDLINTFTYNKID